MPKKVLLGAPKKSVKKESSSGCFLSAMGRKDVVSGGQKPSWYR